MAFQARTDYQNHAIGWLQRGYSFLGGGTVVQFLRIWMSSGKCQLSIYLGDAKMKFIPYMLALAVLTFSANAYAIEFKTLSGTYEDSTGRKVTLGFDVKQHLLKLPPPRPDVNQSTWLLEPASPKYYVIIFVGGKGIVKCPKKLEDPSFGKNWLTRTRLDYANAGASVAIYCAPDDRWDRKVGLLKGRGQNNYRTSVEFETDFSNLVAKLKARHDVPVVVSGTSAGAVAALYITQKKPDLVDILVMSSAGTVTHKGQPESIISDLNADKIQQPTLLVSHVDDPCKFSPIAKSKQLFDAIGSAKKQHVIMEGGKKRKGNACRFFSAHQFYGIEKETVAKIIKFIELNL